MNKENKKPLYASINWGAKSKWDSITINREDIGIGQNGINLVVEYAKKQGVKVEWMEYETYVKFTVVKKSSFIGQAENAPQYAEDIIREITEFGEETPNKYLREAIEIPYRLYKAIIDEMISHDKIVRIERVEGRGRPKVYYDLVEKI